MAGEKQNTEDILIRHDYKKACYLTLLSEFTSEEVAEFFDKVPMHLEGRHIKGPELYKLLWADKAKIYLLETHTHEGKSEFECRELKRLFELSQGQKNANFEVRFTCLVEKLKEECPTVSLTRPAAAGSPWS